MNRVKNAFGCIGAMIVLAACWVGLYVIFLWAKNLAGALL